MGVSFLTRVVAFLVIIIAILQLIHLLLLNKLENERLIELRHFQGYSSEKLSFSFGQSQPQNPDSDLQEAGNGLSASVSPARSSLLLQRGLDRSTDLDSSGRYRIIFNVHQLLKMQSDYDKPEAQTENPRQQQQNKNPNDNDDFSIDNANDDDLPSATSGFHKLNSAKFDELDVTLVTYGDIQSLKTHLVHLVERWAGPISLSVFTRTETELNNTVDLIYNLVQCQTLVRTFVDFHLVFPVDLSTLFSFLLRKSEFQSYQHRRSQDMGTGSSFGRSKRPRQRKKLQHRKKPRVKKSAVCQRLYQNLVIEDPIFNSGAGASVSSSDNNWEHHVNLLMNVGTLNVKTTHVFLSYDIALLPSDQLRTKFKRFLTTTTASSSNPSIHTRSVFLVPVFEVMQMEVRNLPKTKVQLINLVDKNQARPSMWMDSTTCLDENAKSEAQNILDLWQVQRETSLSDDLNVFHKIPVEILLSWDAHFISESSIPSFDEDFDHMIRFNSLSSRLARMAQLCQLHLQGHTLTMLNNAFLVHNGYRYHREAVRQDDLNTCILCQQLKNGLEAKYSNCLRRCD